MWLENYGIIGPAFEGFSETTCSICTPVLKFKPFLCKYSHFQLQKDQDGAATH